MLKLNLGSGPGKLDGWVNVDMAAAERPDVVADLTRPLPFATQSADYIHSEDFIYVLEPDQAHDFLCECRRVLKPQGVLRLLTPDLQRFARAYLHDPDWLVRIWNQFVGLPLKTESACEVFNLGMRLASRFQYDQPTLTRIAAACGLRAYTVAFGQSAHASLCNIDLRRPEDTVSMYLECVPV